MAKKRKIKKRVIILIGMIVFFVVYAGTYIYFSKQQESSEPVKVQDKSTESDNKTLISQMKETDTVYISDIN